MNTDRLTRRSFLAATTATPIAFAAPLLARATTLGDWTVTSLSDGNLQLPTSMILEPLSATQKDDAMTRFAFAEAITPPCNVTLLQNAERTVLIDVGAGTEFQGSAGLLLDSLDALGVAPDDVTDVLFTHAHPDHLWGLLDDFDDLAFWNARYQMGRAEWTYWRDPNTVDTIGAARQSFAVGAARRLERIADQVTLIEDGQEVLPGIAARASFGHTPGHMAFEIRSGSEGLMVLGDCIGNDKLAFANPGWHSGSDQDAEAGAQTRLSLLDQLAQEQMQVLGFHLPGGGIGRVERKDSAYRFVPG